MQGMGLQQTLLLQRADQLRGVVHHHTLAAPGWRRVVGAFQMIAGFDAEAVEFDDVERFGFGLHDAGELDEARFVQAQIGSNDRRQVDLDHFQAGVYFTRHRGLAFGKFQLAGERGLRTVPEGGEHLAVLAGVLVLAGLKDRSATESVAVANQLIQAGQPVSGADVRWVTVHRTDGAAVGGLLDPSSLGGGWVAAVRISPGAPIAMGELTRASGTAGLGAMSIQVPPSRADGGALQIGDRVDVISAASGQAVYIATDLEVLTVDTPQSGVLGGVQDSSYFVTVAVDRATALRLAAALGSSSGATSSNVQVVRSTGEGADPGAAGGLPSAAAAAGAAAAATSATAPAGPGRTK